MDPLKLISINIEGDRHWDRILPFFQNEAPDVICVQELYKTDLPKIESLGYTSSFLPMTIRSGSGPLAEFGACICSRWPITESEHFYYHKPDDEIQEFKREDKNGTMSHGVVQITVSFYEQRFSIATTHFTWTPDGLSDEHQKAHLSIMLSTLREKEPHILCGDFNIPRGHNVLYEELARNYRDEIPETYATSLDFTNHRVSDPKEIERMRTYMVDYVFSQPGYNVSDVRLQFGLSDHAAVVASVSKLETAYKMRGHAHAHGLEDLSQLVRRNQ